MTHPISRRIEKARREGAEVQTHPNGDVIVNYPSNRIAACMILGDAYSHEEVIKCVNSLKKSGVDKLFIAYNGKTRRSLSWLFRRLTKIGLPFVIQKFKWNDDFAEMRNHSFEMVPKDEFDWIMWIDSDDELVVENPQNQTPKEFLNQILDSIDPYTSGVYLRYDYAVDPNTGAVAVQQWRERILSTEYNWSWVYPVHEVILSPPGTQFAHRDGAYIKHARVVNEDRGARERNRKIIAKALKENPENQRMQFYFANEAMAEADNAQDPTEKIRKCEVAILAFKRFLSNPNAQRDDLYLAATRVGDLYLMKGEQNEAIDAYLNSLKIIPDWPDAYIGVARAAMELEDWPRCKAFADLALKQAAPDTAAAVTPLTHKYTPYLLRGIANDEMGNLEDALTDYLAAQAIWTPQNGMLDDKIEAVKNKLAVTTRDKDDRKRLRGMRPEKSIAFVTAPLVEPWHPDLEKESGAGGAETCIMRLAPRFAADGWRVAVFGTPGEHRGERDGVEWWNSNEFLPNEEFSVLISSRLPEIFQAQLAARRKILWMHDVNVGPRLLPFINEPDTIVGLTNWHISHMAFLYGADYDRFSVVPNGIELDLYDWRKKKQSDGDLRFIWSSSPDRGLKTLIALWPVIKSIYPTSRLDIFYGWNIIDKLIKNKQNGYLLKLKMDILSNIAALGGEEGGIYQHGRVPQSELAEWQLNSHIWPYPTDFMETFCITAIEMQAAGAIPIASKLAALNETVANHDLLIEGWPLNSTYQRKWIRTLEEVVEGTEERQLDLQASGRILAEKYTWDNAYEKWMQLFRRLDGR